MARLRQDQVDLLLRVAGLVGWAAVAVPLTGAEPRSLVSPAWVAGYLLFGVLYLVCTGMDPPFSKAGRTLVLALMATGVAVNLVAPAYGYAGVLPLIATAVAAFILPFAAMAVLILVQTTILMAPLWAATDLTAALTQTLSSMGFQFFTAGVVALMRRESCARISLARAHAELESAQAALAENSRTAERLRIARDLHDLVGHQLTALAVNLEVASHVAEGPAKEQVELSRMIAKDLLRDVRAAVGRLREGPVDLPSALRTIGASVPSPEIHLRVPDDLVIPDQPRTEALLRCVQEIITNTIRHADSQNLWIEVSRNAIGEAVVTARDDGKGVASVVPGNGLVGMTERLRQLGGDVSFASESGHGFRVEARLPVAA